MPRKSRRSKKSMSRAGILTRAIDALRSTDESPLRIRGSIAAWVAVLIGLAVAWVIGVPKLRAYGQVHTIGEAVTVEFIDPPAWVNGDIRAMLEATAARYVEATPLDRDGLVEARGALFDTGWFEAVVQVRRSEVGVIVVDAVFVDPYAVVRDGEGDHLVDRNGRLLPRTVPAGSAPQFKAVIGAGQPRPRQSGEPWTGGGVTAALRLIALIDERPWHAQVTAIDISSYTTEHLVFLVTDRGHRIRWGRPPGEESAGEVTTEQKLYYLDYPFENFGHIDGGHDGELDITTSVGVIVR